MVDVDLFGSTASLVGAGVSKAGRPRLPLRLMISLLYLPLELIEVQVGNYLGEDDIVRFEDRYGRA